MALIVVDFDGTITESDSLVEIVQTHAPQLFDELEDDLDAGRITLHQCIEREFAAVRGDHDTIVAEAIGRVRVALRRAGERRHRCSHAAPFPRLARGPSPPTPANA